MKKLLSFSLIFVLLILSACSKPQNDVNTIKIDDSTQTKQSNDITDVNKEFDQPTQEAENITNQQNEPELNKPLPEYTSTGTDCEIVELASKTEFNEDIVFDWNGNTITVEKPKFTGIKIDEVYSYKAYYEFNNDKLESIWIGDEYITINKYGEYQYISESPVKHNKIRHYTNEVDLVDGLQVSENTKYIQTGEPGSFQQRLYSLDDEPLSDYYDTIGHFYNGLALVTRNNKIGFIDEKGLEVLKPCIAYDKIQYPPKNKKFSIHYMDQDAFIIPIGGELAVVNLTRTNVE